MALYRLAALLPLVTAIAYAQQAPISSDQQFTLKDSFIGADFLNGFTWETFDDPTHGRVNFVDQNTALSNELSYVDGDKFFMRADSTKTVNPADRGRDSVRITSKSAYNSTIVVLDLAHMPAGCATWPAFWSLSQKGPWPNGGEIDMVEGVNLGQKNLMSLHTTPGCQVPPDRTQTGTSVSTNCDSSINFNQGCGTSFNKANSYGDCFNKNGGGWFVMQKDPSGVKGYFWDRHDSSVPPEVSCSNPDDVKEISSGAWGIPEAAFPMDDCGYDAHFNDHVIVFDLTLCGDWAGSAYSTSGCPGTCNDYVNNNPAAFQEAFWEINSLRVYSMD